MNGSLRSSVETLITVFLLTYNKFMFDSGYNLPSLEGAFNLISTTEGTLRLNVNVCYLGGKYSSDFTDQRVVRITVKKHYSLRSSSS